MLTKHGVIIILEDSIIKDGFERDDKTTPKEFADEVVFWGIKRLLESRGMNLDDINEMFKNG